MINFRYKFIISIILLGSTITCSLAKCNDLKKFTCTNGQCISIYALCDGTVDCTDGSDENLDGCSTISCPEYTFRCAYGACIDMAAKCNGITDCADGSDESPKLCTSTHGTRSIRSASQSNVTCSPIISESVDAECELNSVKVNCSKPMADGTMVRTKCKPYYVAADVPTHVRLCRDGSWDYPLLKCVPECGQLPFKAQQLILIDRPEEDTSVVPWHVGVYKRNKANHYIQMCGGSIISPNIIVSVAHCFTSQDGTVADAKQYVVAAGKYDRNYDDEQDITAQKIQVKEIVIPPQFRGLLTNYIGDISFVVLEKPFTITRTVQPVCIDWSNQYEPSQLKEHNAGMVASWGLPNSRIQQLNVPFIDYAQCHNEMPESLVRYITADKFCSGYTNGTGVCLGDSGNGLAFKRKDVNKYYLRGVASVGSGIDLSCKSDSYQIYTKLSNYLSLLQTIVHRQ